MAYSDESFEAELRDKNLKRVEPQVIRRIAHLKQSVKVSVVMTILCIGVGVGGVFIHLIPAWLGYAFLALLPFQVIGIFADYHLYKAQKAKLAYVRKRIKNRL
jgi:membrane protein YdbS with pleckstrin-like domain